MRVWLKLAVSLGLAMQCLACAKAQTILKAAEISSSGPQFTVRNPEDKNPQTITKASFGFQCGTGKSTNCPNSTWPTSIAQPGMIRLWDSQVQWYLLNPKSESYDWRILDAYLDTIAAHQPRDAMYTFGYTPCWDTKGACEAGWGSTYPPSDLTANGSLSFNSFVTALVTHCSRAGNCVSDRIKYWELWNEANADSYWNGTVSQLYQLMAPAVPIIRSKVSGAIILTPPANRGDTDWMRSWLEQENTNGRLSDIFSLHVYLQGATPESRFHLIQQMVELKNGTPGWASTPWMNSETNFDAAKFACQESADECIGRMVRWHLIHFAFGAQQLSWFYFNTTIGRNADFSAAYKTMMDWLVGGHFVAGCSVNSNVVTCPFVEANSHRALFVWTLGGESSYSPTAPYADYKTLGGNTVSVPNGQKVSIGVKPIMLEEPN